MTWGKSVPKAPPPSTSAFMRLLPLFILFVIIGIGAFVGYHIYLSVQKISSAASEKMQSKNVVFSKDGVKVGVKHLRNESYVDATQGFLVKAWNLSTWPAYKSKLWNQQPAGASAGGKVESRKP
ncbi:hypothetical protein G7Y89_g6101 [Cudoniella acicularis]|uniref:Uncharacterized protein n=1 Tax=Cudoniella acicularis TaxID=354080 RepID=A0A8H4W532_9HELO|nr:hypothetical protein G7Y89_g6101 [Cudoniella acicularis]